VVGRVGSCLVNLVRKLVDLALRCVESFTAQPVEALAPLPERDRVVERHAAALEALDDLRQLPLGLLERRLGHSTVSTVAEKPPSATRTSTVSPAASEAVVRRAA